MIKAVLFDLDNTLIDWMAMKKEGLKAGIAAMVRKGLNMDESKGMELMFGIMKKYGYEYSFIFQRFLKEANGELDYKILAAGIIAYRLAQKKYIKPYDKVKPTLNELKARGVKIGIVSDAPRLKAWMRLTELGLEDMFDVVVAYGDVRERKPSKEPFKKALRELNLEAVEVLMVGDMPERDIDGGKAMGMKTCLAKYGCFVEIESNADYTINKIEELLEIAK